jgi:histidine ammonia-lyase
LQPGKTIADAMSVIRSKVPFAEEDRVFAKDIEAIRGLIRSGALMASLNKTVGELEW